MIVKKHIQHAVVRQLTREVGGDATYETAMKQAAFLGKRVMTKTCRHMVVGDKLDTVFMSYICTAGMEAMREMANKMDLAKITTRTVWVQPLRQGSKDQSKWGTDKTRTRPGRHY
ncbi:hypothetical protein CLOP_g5851 [Closterium sp. NIES-67]|nr:hypothetical protein CLOP_g5851 [Closterium sp. NIES-67]